MKKAQSAALWAFNKTGSIIALAAFCLIGALLLHGCVAIEVEDYGVDVVKDAAGNPVCDTNGTVQTVHKGQRWHYNKNMVEQSYDSIDFQRKPGDDIAFKIANYKDTVSPELNKVVETSFKGAAELAAKIGAAIATSGGSVAGDAAASAISQSVKNYISNGGSVENAQVTCDGTNCTISDGTVTETCENCVDPAK